MFAIPQCDCGSERFLSNQGIAPKSRVFPFEARHVSPDGKPMIIESMKHLRDVERSHGVVFSAFNNNENNSIDATKGDLPRYRGEDEDFRRDHKR
jgi:hypothetical protein